MTMENKEIERALADELAHIRSVDELEGFVGELSPDEQDLLNRLDLPRNPTDDELAAIDHRLAARVVARTFKRIGDQWPGMASTTLGTDVDSGFTLLELLAEVHVNCLFEKVPAPELARTSAQVGARLGSLWLRQLERDAEAGERSA